MPWTGAPRKGCLLLQSDEISVDGAIAMLDRCHHPCSTATSEASLRAAAGDFIRHARVQAKRAKHRGAAHSFAAMAGGAA